MRGTDSVASSAWTTWTLCGWFVVLVFGPLDLGLTGQALELPEEKDVSLG